MKNLVNSLVLKSQLKEKDCTEFLNTIIRIVKERFIKDVISKKITMNEAIKKAIEHNNNMYIKAIDFLSFTPNKTKEQEEKRDKFYASMLDVVYNKINNKKHLIKNTLQTQNKIALLRL